jgi:HD-GYP domain-containing protein (c-di-GMP phosphodiesterase class II)
VNVHHDQVWVVLASQVEPHPAPDGLDEPHAGAVDQNPLPLSGRIAAVADVFDALTHYRPYKRAWPVEAAVAEITRGRGSQLDPGVVDAFLGISEKAAVDLGRGSVTTATEVTSSAPQRSRRRVSSR